MLGYAVIGAGALLLWIAATGKADKFFEALKIQLPNPGSGNTIVATPSSGNSLINGSGDGNVDSGTHQGLAADGTIFTIDKAYQDMSDAEKDAANNFAHVLGG